MGHSKRLNAVEAFILALRRHNFSEASPPVNKRKAAPNAEAAIRSGYVQSQRISGGRFEILVALDCDGIDLITVTRFDVAFFLEPVEGCRNSCPLIELLAPGTLPIAQDRHFVESDKFAFLKWWRAARYINPDQHVAPQFVISPSLVKRFPAEGRPANAVLRIRCRIE